MASKMAGVQTLLVLLVLAGVCVAGGTACPSPCTCSAFRGQPQDLHVDCAGKGLLTIPADFPANMKSLNLANNRLTKIGRKLSGLNLVALDLSGNNIRELSYDEQEKEAITDFKGDCSLEDFVYNRISYVSSGRWDIVDLTEVEWPCTIDLRNNPISKIGEGAFQGSENFTLLLGQADSNLTIENGAFRNTTNVIGLHISDLTHLRIEDRSFQNMANVGWIVIDKTELRMTARPHLDEDLNLRWLRISNSNVTRLDYLSLSMDVDTDCYLQVRTYHPNERLAYSKSTIHKGGIEIINNTLPVLKRQLFGNSNVGGVYFKRNKIMHRFAYAFEQYGRSTELCILRFDDNEMKTFHAVSFGGLKNVVHVSIAAENLASIEPHAFYESMNIGSFSIFVTGNQENDQVVIERRAFYRVTNVKIFNITFIDDVVSPRLLLKPRLFDGLRDVEYMTVNLYENMHTLPNGLFIGLIVNQMLTLSVRNLTRVNKTAFGGINMDRFTRIKRLDVTGMHNVPCDCETAKLNFNMKLNVDEVVGLTCTASFDDGTISHDWPLDHATCSASSLQFSLALVISFSLFLNF